MAGVANYGGRQPDNTQNIKQFTTTPYGIIDWVYKKISNIRIELSSQQIIQGFCKTNNIESILSSRNVTFNQKMSHKDESDNIVSSADFDDWNFRVSLNRETTLPKGSSIVKDIVTNWSNTKKIYRLINRVTSCMDSFMGNPFKVDLSIVKESHKNVQGRMTPENNIHEAELFDDSPKYEIEIELDNKLVGSDMTKESLNSKLKNVVSIILAGLQQTNYVISYPEQERILQDYMKIIMGKEYKQNMRVFSKHFIGPSSYTLQLNNISEVTQDSIVPNIRNNYTVTDKADGERKLLFINRNKLYLIDTNMNVQNVGAENIGSRSYMFNDTIIDGEHITQDKNGNFINL
jgi:hypothetical protein